MKINAFKQCLPGIILFFAGICIPFGRAFALDFHILGVSDTIQQNIALRLDSQIRSLGTPVKPDRFQNFLTELPDDVKKAMQPYGYFEPSVTIAVKKNNLIEIKIQPKRQLKWTQIHFDLLGEGLGQKAFERYQKDFPLKKNTPFSIEDYEKVKKDLYQSAEEQGYLDAKLIESKIQINLKTYQSTATIIFDTGPRYYFGPIHFNQFNKPFLSESLLYRYTHFLNNKPYSPDKLITLQNNLNNANYFSEVTVKPELEKKKDFLIPVDIDLKPNQSKTYTLGLGYGTDTKIRGTAGAQFRRLNAQGHQLQMLIQGSPIQSLTRALYIIPGRNPVTDEYHINLNFFHQNLSEFDSRAGQLGIASMTTRRGWERTLGINALIEQELNSVTNPDHTTNWLYPSLQLHKIKANDPLNTKNGYSVNFIVQGSSKAILSDASFAQIRFDGKYIISPNDMNRFLFRGSLGYTLINNIDRLAPSLRFYTGGSQSIRGYHYLSIGPGKTLRVASIEWQHLIKDKWSVALFCDTGNVTDNLDEALITSVGLGLVRSSPLGNFNFGLARPLQARDKTVQLVFSMGPDLV